MNEQISSAGCNPLHRRDQKLPRGKRRITGNLNWAKSVVFFLLCATTATALPAQTLTTLHSFDGTDGAYSSAVLVQATDGNLYGTTAQRGAYGWGTVFKITPSGTLTTLHDFDDMDGAEPLAGLVQGADGDLYGTTTFGGAYDSGTVFKITLSGTLTTLYSFSFCSETPCFGGFGLGWPLVQATDGNFYGTTFLGGLNGWGTVFKITPSGTLNTLDSFCSDRGCPDGLNPNSALVRATDGSLYGTTAGGGALDWGTVFKISPDSGMTTVYSFCSESGCADGTGPTAGLVQATDGNLYGATSGGGANGFGTVFKLTPSGTLTTLHSFDSMDGSYPVAALIQASDGNLYGTMRLVGNRIDSSGTVFKITPDGTFTTLYRFCSQNAGCPDGSQPFAGLVQATNGKFYGTTYYGGTNNLGTIFSLDVGVGPPTNKDQCKDGGWKTFTIPRKFKNQGDCVSFVNTRK